MRKKSLRAMKSAVFQAPESRAEAILQNILGANNDLVPPEAPFEEILQAILYNTPYTKEAEARIEEILLAIKNNGTYDGEPQSRDEEILISKLNQTPYTKDAESRIEELFILWAAQSIVKQLEGVPPLTFTAIGNPLISWSIYGDLTQTGTPTPSSPIIPSETGDIVTSGEHSGEYILPIECGGETTPVYTAEPLRKIGDYIDYKSNSAEYRAIGKYIITGQEAWYGYSQTVSGKGASLQISDMFVNGRDNGFCNAFKAQYSPNQSSIDGITFGVNNNSIYITFSVDTATALNLTNTQSIKDYFAEQYANGTPVTVWYVLATPTTTTVEAPEIPTVNGSNTFDVDTSLKPSNVYIEYQ